MKQSSHGLIRTIGRWSLTALMVNSIIGVSIFRLPSLLAEKIGAYSPLSCLGAGVGILIIAGCIAEVSSRYEETGGLYLYARDALGRFAGLLVAWLTWLTRIAAPAAAADLFYTYAAQFFPSLGTRSGELLVLAILIGQLAVFNYIGVKTGKHVSNFFTAVKVGFLLLFVTAGIACVDRAPGDSRAAPVASGYSQELVRCDAVAGVRVWRIRGRAFGGRRISEPQARHACCIVNCVGVDCIDLYRGADHHSEDLAGRGGIRKTPRGRVTEIPGDGRSDCDCTGCSRFRLWLFECQSIACPTADLCACQGWRFPPISRSDPSPLPDSLYIHRGVCGAGIRLCGAGNISVERGTLGRFAPCCVWRDGSGGACAAQAKRWQGTISAPSSLLFCGIWIALLRCAFDTDTSRRALRGGDDMRDRVAELASSSKVRFRRDTQRRAILRVDDGDLAGNRVAVMT